MNKFASLPNEDPMITYCRTTAAAKYEDFPTQLMDWCKNMILDTIGNMVAGSTFDGIPQVVKIVQDKGGRPDSPILFYGDRVPASEAAMAIAPMARAIDWAAIHPEAMHSTEHDLPPLLAAPGLAKNVKGRIITGKEMLTAYAMGQEVSVRIGSAFRGNMGVELGRSNGHYIFGAVIGTAKMLGLNQEEMENAFGISRSMTAPHDMAAFHPPTTMIKIHHGFIAQDAINCCVMAQAGITGPRQNVLLEPRGFLGFAKWETRPNLLLDGFGEQWEQMNIQFKQYLGCLCGHTSMLGLLKLIAEHGFSPDDIEAILVHEDPLNYAVVAGPDDEKQNPQNMYQAQFSVPYLMSVVAYDGETDLSIYFKESWDRPQIRAMMKKIVVRSDDSLPEWAARVKVTLKDGREFTRTTQGGELKGTPQTPYTRDELIYKFKKTLPYCAMKIDDSLANKIVDVCFNLEKVQDVQSELVELMIPKK